MLSVMLPMCFRLVMGRRRLTKRQKLRRNMESIGCEMRQRSGVKVTEKSRLQSETYFGCSFRDMERKMAGVWVPGV